MKILVVGATGFVGRHLVRALLTAGHHVRALVRDPARADAIPTGAEIVQGDIADATSIDRAVASMDAVYLCMHTLGRQPASSAGFMDIEEAGIEHVIAACKKHGARRVIYLTAVGIAAEAKSEWIHGRWRTEERLLRSGLDTTVIRPGQIVGKGGLGFGMMVKQAKRTVAVTLGSGESRSSNIALDDLLYYMTGVLADPRAFGQRFDVGTDESFTGNEAIDLTAALLGKRPPWKVHVPLRLLALLAPVIERLTGAPRGAIQAIADALGFDGIADPMPIRAILPRPPLPYRDAVLRALRE